MSTVPEVVAARDEGMGVLVLSLVTNKVVIPEGYASAREEVEAEVSVLHLVCGPSERRLMDWCFFLYSLPVIPFNAPPLRRCRTKKCSKSESRRQRL